MKHGVVHVNSVSLTTNGVRHSAPPMVTLTPLVLVLVLGSTASNPYPLIVNVAPPSTRHVPSESPHDTDVIVNVEVGTHSRVAGSATDPSAEPYGNAPQLRHNPVVNAGS